MQNPYTNRGMIRDPSMFFGRSEELARIYAWLANTQSVSIIGDRRIGKSSLLYCLAQPTVQTRVQGHDFSDYVFVHIDLQGSIHKTPDEFLGYLLGKFRLQARGRLKFGASSKASQEVFEETIAQINAKGFKIVFLFDEFDAIVRNDYFDASFFGFLRFIATNYNLSLVTASQRRLANLSRSSINESHFFNIFGVVTLGALNQNEAEDLITMPSAKAGYPLVDEVAWVLHLAGTHPFFIQIACFYLFEARAHLQGNRGIDHDAVRKLFNDEAQDHFNYALQHLISEDRQILQEEVWKEQGLYRYYLATSAEFRRFVREQSEKPESKMHLITTEALEDALERLWDIAALGQSPLTNLSTVRTRLAQGDFTSIPDTGQALREVLIAAIQHLRAGGREEKADKRWRYWFILQRRYVEKEQNKDIIAMLNVADRTFYRERNEAIVALVTVIRDMEVGPR